MLKCKIFFSIRWKNEYRTTICVQCVMDIFIIKSKTEFLSLNAMTHNKKSGNSRLRLLVPLNEYSNSAMSHSTNRYNRRLSRGSKASAECKKEMNE